MKQSFQHYYLSTMKKKRGCEIIPAQGITHSPYFIFTRLTMLLHPMPHLRFIFAIDASVGMFIGQTSAQESDFEQPFPKCAA